MVANATNASAYQDLLRRRKDRACAIILSVKDREIDPHLDARSAEKLRKVILDQFNEFFDVARDIVASLETGGPGTGPGAVVNQLYLDRLSKIDDLYEVVVNGASPNGRSPAGKVG